MTLEESVDGLEKLESNGVTAWIDPRVHEYVGQMGDINVDFIDDGTRRGYILTAGKSSDGKDCDGCSCG
jgi:Fe-S cluster assembly iron-binding protein IscA